MDWQAMWARTPAGALALAAVVLASGCGGAGSQRRAVDAYVDQVNAITAREQHELTNAQVALDRFSATTWQEQKALRRAQAMCDKLLRRVDGLEPPAAGRAVQRRLVDFLAADRDAAAAAADLNEFLAAQLRPQARLHAVETKLAATMRTARVAATQRRAFATFAADVGALQHAFGELAARGVAVAWRAADVARLGRLHTAADQVADALGRHDAAGMRTGLARVQWEIRGVDAVIAERHAVSVYERLVHRVARAEVALAEARVQLRRRFA